MSLHFERVTLPLAEFTLTVNTSFHASSTGLSGPSGAGKTSLLELIVGLRQPATGVIRLHDRVLVDVERGYSLPPETRGVGYVPQDLALFPHLNVRQNLFFGHTSGTAADCSAEPEKVIALLEIGPLLDRRIHAISGGEKQRVALGRALLAAPRLLLLDEPLSNLDPRLKSRILPYLQAIRQELQLPILHVSHLREELDTLCDEVRYMERGEMVTSS